MNIRALLLTLCLTAAGAAAASVSASAAYVQPGCTPVAEDVRMSRSDIAGEAEITGADCACGVGEGFAAPVCTVTVKMLSFEKGEDYAPPEIRFTEEWQLDYTIDAAECHRLQSAGDDRVGQTGFYYFRRDGGGFAPVPAFDCR